MCYITTATGLSLWFFFSHSCCRGVSRINICVGETKFNSDWLYIQWDLKPTRCLLMFKWRSPLEAKVIMTAAKEEISENFSDRYYNILTHVKEHFTAVKERLKHLFPKQFGCREHLTLIDPLFLLKGKRRSFFHCLPGHVSIHMECNANAGVWTMIALWSESVVYIVKGSL